LPVLAALGRRSRLSPRAGIGWGREATSRRAAHSLRGRLRVRCPDRDA
jgi:hypothetical protein